MASLTYVGGTETYTENIQVQRSVSMQDNSNILTEDRQDEFWKDEYYYEGSSTALTDGFHLQFCNNTSEGMKFLSRHFTTDKIGTTITSKITFLKAFKNVQIPYVVWDNTIDGIDVTEENCTIKLNDTVITTLSVKKENFQEGVTSTIALNKTIGDIAIGDVISFEDSKSGTISDTSAYRDLLGGLRFDFSSDPVYFMETVPVQKTRGINKPVSSIYAGVTATVPKYTETTTTEDVALSSATFTDFFSADNTGTTGTNAKGITWADNSGGGLKLTFGNYGIDSSTSMTTFTAQRDLTNVVIKGLYYTESNYDKITLTVAGTIVLNAVSGTSSSLTQRWSGSLSKGQTIALKFVKDSSNSATNESSTYFALSCNPYQKTVTTKTQTGTETKLVDKKIVKGYVGGPDGKARLFFGGGGFSYTGEYTEQDYTSSNGTKHKLYTLTTGGEMKLTQEAGYWMCGAGCSGEANRRTTSSKPYTYESGKGGCGGHVASGTMLPGTWQVLIGAGGDTSKNGAEANSGGNTSITFGSTTTTAEGGNIVSGGSGGGSATSYRYSVSQRDGGSGDGVSTIPFGLTSLGKASPGGGGGGFYVDESRKRNGGAGGSNGEDGGDTSTGGGDGGAGGEEGGGRGGNRSLSTSESGRAATFYGGAGGGGAAGGGSWAATNGGAGYQGVVYIAIPPITTT